MTDYLGYASKRLHGMRETLARLGGSAETHETASRDAAPRSRWYADLLPVVLPSVTEAVTAWFGRGRGTIPDDTPPAPVARGKGRPWRSVSVLALASLAVLFLVTRRSGPVRRVHERADRVLARGRS